MEVLVLCLPCCVMPDLVFVFCIRLLERSNCSELFQQGTSGFGRMLMEADQAHAWHDCAAIGQPGRCAATTLRRFGAAGTRHTHAASRSMRDFGGRFVRSPSDHLSLAQGATLRLNITVSCNFLCVPTLRLLFVVVLHSFFGCFF